MSSNRSQVDAQTSGCGPAWGQPQLPTVAWLCAAFAASAGWAYKHTKKGASARRVFSALKTHKIPGDIGNSVRTAKCGNSSTGRSSPGIAYALSSRKDLATKEDIVPYHLHPRHMGGAWRDDHPQNIQAVHWWCNG